MKNLSSVLLLIVAFITVVSSEVVHAQMTGLKSTFQVRAVSSDITINAADVAHPVCTPFSNCPLANQITGEYIASGVDFTLFNSNPPAGVFADPPDQFAGINDVGTLDLLTAVCGRIVELGTTTQGLTDFIGVAGGLVPGPTDLLLEAYDINGVLIGSSIADDGFDADGRHIAEVSDVGGSIASFCMSTPTADTFGVNNIYLNNPTAAPVTLQSFSIE